VIVVGETEGKVERIEFRATHIHTGWTWRGPPTPEHTQAHDIGVAFPRSSDGLFRRGRGQSGAPISKGLPQNNLNNCQRVGLWLVGRIV